MKIALISPMRCHHFDLAARLQKLGINTNVFTAYPRWKLKKEALPQTYIHTYPWIFKLKLALPYFGIKIRSLDRKLDWWTRKTLDQHLYQHLPDCDIFESLSSYLIKTARKVQSNGATYITHRGSAHMRYQSNILKEENERWGFHWDETDPRVAEQEIEEYEIADRINVPSAYVKNTFIKAGVSPDKIICLPYGADLTGFFPTTKPDKNEFIVLFAGIVNLRKGFLYLLEAFEKFKHPNKKLIAIGDVWPEVKSLLHKFNLDNVHFLGKKPRDQLKNWMSKSHVMVLPSIDDGFGKVISEAMACACPVICSENTGAPGYITHGKEGFIIPIRDTDSIKDHLQQLADAPELQQQMSQHALEKVKQQRGWDEYTEQYIQLCQSLINQKGI